MPRDNWKSLFNDDELRKITGAGGNDEAVIEKTAMPQAQGVTSQGLPDILQLTSPETSFHGGQHEQPKPEFEGYARQFGKGLRVGWDGVRLGFQGTRAMAIGDEQERNEFIEKRIRPIQKRMHQDGYLPSSMEFHQIGSMQDASEWVVGQMGALTPIVGSIMAGSMTGGAAGAKIGTAAGPKGKAAGTIIGSSIGGFLQGYNLYAGGLYGDLLEMGVEHDLAKQTALKYAVPASAVSIVVPSAVSTAIIAGLPRQFVRARAKSIAIGAGLGTVTEGVAEGIAETFVVLGEEFATGERYPEEVRRMRILDAAAAGSLMGTTMGIAGGGAMQHVSLDQHIETYVDTNLEVSQQVQRPVVYNFLVEQIEARKESKGLLPEEESLLKFLKQSDDLTQADNRPINKIVNENDKVLVEVFKSGDGFNKHRLITLMGRNAKDPGSLSMSELVELTGIMMNKPAIVEEVMGAGDVLSMYRDVDTSEATGASQSTGGETAATDPIEAPGEQVQFLHPDTGMPSSGELISRDDSVVTVRTEDGTEIEMDQSLLLKGARPQADSQPEGTETHTVTYFDGQKKKDAQLELSETSEGVYEADVSSMQEKQAKSIVTQLNKKYPNVEFELTQQVDESQPFAEPQRTITGTFKQSEAFQQREQQSQEQRQQETLGNYEARSRGGARVDVVNKKTNKPISPRSPYYNTVVLNHFENNFEEVNQTPRIDETDPDVSMANYTQKVAQEGQNPFEIVEVYLGYRASNPEQFDPVRSTIADMLTRIPTENYSRFGDPNQIQWNREIPMNYFTREGGIPIDVQAQEMSDAAGVEITPQDIIDFINDFTGGQRSYYTQASFDPLLVDLKDTFEEVTGVVLTDSVAEGLDAIISARFAQQDGQAEAKGLQAELDEINTSFADMYEQQGWDEYYRKKNVKLDSERKKLEETRREEDAEIERQAQRDKDEADQGATEGSVDSQSTDGSPDEGQIGGKEESQEQGQVETSTESTEVAPEVTSEEAAGQQSTTPADLEVDLPPGFSLGESPYVDSIGLYNEHGQMIYAGDNNAAIQRFIDETIPSGTPAILNPTVSSLRVNRNKFTIEQIVSILEQNDPNGEYRDWLTEISEAAGVSHTAYLKALKRTLAAARESLDRVLQDFTDSFGETGRIELGRGKSPLKIDADGPVVTTMGKVKPKSTPEAKKQAKPKEPTTGQKELLDSELQRPPRDPDYVPKDSWWEHLIKARGYAHALGLEINDADGKTRTTEKLVSLINRKLSMLESKKYDPKPKAKPNTVFTKEAAEEARKRLLEKLGRAHIGLDPQMLIDGITLAGYHIEAGARTFSAYARAMSQDLGDAVKPYLKQWYNAVYDSPEIEGTGIREQMTQPDDVRAADLDEILADTQEAAVQGPDAQGFINEATEAIRRAFLGETLAAPTSRQLEALAEKYGITDVIEMRELIESAIHDLARDVANDRYGPSASKSSTGYIYGQLVDLYKSQPSLQHRDSRSIELQQYSTPIPITFIAQKFTQADQGVRTFEPSAGNGLMVYAANPANTIVNEIDGARRNVLSGRGYYAVWDRDGSKPFSELARTQQAVLTNPPFGSIPATKFGPGKITPAKITKLEHLMALEALETMADDGKAGIVIGGHMEFSESGMVQGADKPFFNYLFNNYNVRDVIDIDGSLYRRQGTGINVRMILIDGRKETPEGYAPTKEEFKPRVNSYEELYERTKELIAASERQDVTPLLQSQIYEDGRRGVGAGGVGTDTDTGTQRGHIPGTSGTGVSTGADQSDGARSGAEQADKRGSATVEGLDSGRSGRTGIRQPGLPPDGKKSGPVDLFDIGNEDVGGSDRGGLGAVSPTTDGTGGPGTTGRSYGRVEKGDKRSGESAPRDIGDLVASEGQKIPYTPRSRGKSVVTVIPAGMAQSAERALDQIEAEHGPVDEYVLGKLQYDSKEALYKAFSGEQIDALAMGIYQHDNGQAIVIGDMTGVGKGRIAAGMLWYGHLLGKKPVFLTKGPALFSDMYRDLKNIGKEHLRPFIVNTASGTKSDVLFTNEDGEQIVVHKALSAERQKKYWGKGDIPGYDMVFATYSQFSNNTSKNKREFLREMAHDNLLVMDESHMAAGQESNTGIYFREDIIPHTSGVMFLSATFAKRHDNMALYALKTGVRESNLSGENLEEAVGKGGYAILELIASNLAESGQMVRRERSYDGVQVDWAEIDTVAPAEQRRQYDMVAGLLRKVIDFQDEHVRQTVKDLNKKAKKEGKEVVGEKGAKKAGVDNQPFVSRVHNVVEQLFFSLKATAVADKAIEMAREGTKPIVAIRNTMDAFFDDLNVKPGDSLTDIDFSRSVERSLRTVLKIREKDAWGNEFGRQMDPSELGSDGEAAYYDLLEEIRNTVVGLPLSPIDVILTKLKQAGLSGEEVTGRKTQIELNDDLTSGTVVRRKETNPTKIIKNFNFGKTDVLLINASGSTGVSMHSDPNFSDTRPRAMIIHQPELDIVVEVQKRGRIHRTGQVSDPKYLYLTSSLPAEQRLMMMLKTKLKSLDANTTSSQKSSSKMLDIEDFFNKYGDKVVTQYLADKQNDELNYVWLYDPLKMRDKSENDIDRGVPDAARKVTGRVALLPSDMQAKFYTEVGERYNALIEHLNEMGQNDLVVQALPLEAETLEQRVLVAGNPLGKTAFSEPSYLEKVDVNILRKPLTREEIGKEITATLGEKTAEQYKEELLAYYDDTMQARQEADIKTAEERYASQMAKVKEKGKSPSQIAEKLEQLKRHLAERIETIDQGYQNHRMGLRRFLNSFTVGHGVRFPEDGGRGTKQLVDGVFLGVTINKGAKNPLAPSNVKFTFALADSKRKVSLPASQATLLNAILGATHGLTSWQQNNMLDGWDSGISKYQKGRQTRYVVSGDVLKGLAYMDVGRLLRYTTKDGELKAGILLPESYDVEKNIGSDMLVRVSDPQVLEHVEELGWGEKFILDKGVGLEKDGSDFVFFVPKSKKQGGKYFADIDIQNITVEGKFSTARWGYRGQMTATVRGRDLGRLLGVLDEKIGMSVAIPSKESFDTSEATAKAEQDHGVEPVGYVGPRSGTEAVSTEAGEQTRVQLRDLSYDSFPHTNTGETMHVVKMTRRFDRSEFMRLKQIAREYGGFYSSFSKLGAIPGFLFKTTEASQQFMEESGKTDFVNEEFAAYSAEALQEMTDGEILAAYGSRKKYEQAIAEVQEQLDMFGSEQAAQTDSPQRASFRVPGIEQPVLRRTIPEDYRENGFVDFVGRKVNSPKDIAQMMAIHRSPLIEKFHALLLGKDNKVLGFSSITSNAPNFVDLGRDYQAQIIDKAKKHNAAKVVLVHNHPSGNSRPSIADVYVTYTLQNQINNVFALDNETREMRGEDRLPAPAIEHVVINGDNFHLINLAWLDNETRTMMDEAMWPRLNRNSIIEQVSEMGTLKADQSWESAFKVKTEKDPLGPALYTGVLKNLPLESSMIGVVFTTTKGDIVAWENFPADITPGAFYESVREIADKQGAITIITVTSDRGIGMVKEYVPKTARLLENLPSNVFQQDHFHEKVAENDEKSWVSLRGAEESGAYATIKGLRNLLVYEQSNTRFREARKMPSLTAAQSPRHTTLWSVWDDISNYERQNKVTLDEHARWNVEDMNKPNEQAIRIANTIRDRVSQWVGSEGVVVAERIMDLPQDVRYRLAAMKDLPGAFRDQGRVYLPVFAHSTEKKAWEALVTEILSDRGISGLTDFAPTNVRRRHVVALNQYLNEVYSDYADSQHMRHVEQRLGMDTSTDIGKRLAAERLVGYLASHGAMLPMEARLNQVVRELLSDLGYDGAMHLPKIIDDIGSYWRTEQAARSNRGPVEFMAGDRVLWDDIAEQSLANLRESREYKRPTDWREVVEGTNEIEAHIDKMLEKWQNPSSVIFARDLSDLPLDLQMYYLSRRRVNGLWQDGTTYILAWNLESKEEAQRVLLHEVIGHEGVRAWVRNVFGEGQESQALNNLYDDIYKSYAKHPEYRYVAQKYGLDMRNKEDRRVASDEFLAHLAEEGDTANFVDRIVTYLRNWLREAGFDLAISNSELRVIIRNAHRAIEGPGDGPGSGTPGETQEQTKQTASPIRMSLLDMETRDEMSRVEFRDDYKVEPGHKRLMQLKGFFMEPLHFLEKKPKMKYIADSVRDHFDRWAQHRGKLRGWMYSEVVKPMKKLPRKERDRVIKDYAEYQRLKETGAKADAEEFLARTHELVRAMVDVTLRIGKYAGDLNEALGVQVYDPALKAWRPIGRVADFFPRKMNKLTEMTLRNPAKHVKHWNALVDALIAEGHVETAAEADKYLKTYIQESTQTDYFAGVEKARTRALPSIAYDYSFDVMIDYAERWSERISQIENFGQETEPGTYDLFNEAINERISDEQTRHFVGALRDRVYNKNLQDGFHQTLAGLNKITTGLQLGNYGTATLNLFGGLTLNFIAYPSKATAKAMLDLSGVNLFVDNLKGGKGFKKALKDLIELRALADAIEDGIHRGALNNDMINLLRDTDNITGTLTLPEWTAKIGLEDRTVDLNHALNRFVNFTMKWGGYTPTEMLIRSHAQLSGKYFLMDALESWNNDVTSRKSLQRIRWMQENGFDYRRLLREGGEGAYTERFIRYASNLTQGSYKVDQVPIHLDTPIGRFIFKYVKFITQVSRLYYKNVHKPFVDTISKGGSDVRVEVDGVMTTKRVAEFHSVLRYFGAAMIGGEFVRGMRHVLFGYMFQGAELDELEKALEDDERMLMLSLLFERAFWNMQAVGALTIFGNYGQIVSDVYSRERMRNPLEPPPVGMLKGVGELAVRNWEQGTLTARDIDDVLQGSFSLYRTTKRPVLGLLDQTSENTGLDVREAKYWSAIQDRNWSRKQVRRFHDEEGIEGRRTASGRIGRTENSPINQAIFEALLVGEGQRASEVFLDEASSRTGEELARLRLSVQSSMRSRHPFGNMPEEQKNAFMEWAERRLPAESVQRLSRADSQYMQAREVLYETMRTTIARLKDIDQQIERLEQATDTPEHRQRIERLRQRREKVLEQIP